MFLYYSRLFLDITFIILDFALISFAKGKKTASGFVLFNTETTAVDFTLQYLLFQPPVLQICTFKFSQRCRSPIVPIFVHLHCWCIGLMKDPVHYN